MNLTNERIFCVTVVLSTGLCAYLFFIFAANGKLELPGTKFFRQSPLKVATKYNVDNDPSQTMVTLAWPITLLSNILAAVFMYKACKYHNIFPPTFYITWAMGAILSAVWTYTFDRELHAISAVLVLFVSIMYPIQLYVGVKTYHAKGKILPETLKMGLRRVVLDSAGIMATWSFTAMTSTLTHALAFEYSAHLDKPILRAVPGMDASVKLGLAFFAAGQAMWTICDVIIYPKYTCCIRNVYPMIMFCAFGMFLSNYDPEIGMNVYNEICVGLGLAATFCFLFRNWIKGTVQTTMVQYEATKMY